MSDTYQPRTAVIVDMVGEIMWVQDDQMRYHQMLKAPEANVGDKGTVTWKKPNWVWTAKKQQP